jgi:AbiV family abortive infection protein
MRVLTNYFKDDGVEVSRLVEDIKSNRISLFEILEFDDGDYQGAVISFKIVGILLENSDLRKAFLSDLKQRIEASTAETKKIETVEKELSRKQGHKRFEKLSELRNNNLSSSRLLSGESFSSCLSQYLELISHVEDLWAKACKSYRSLDFPLAAFLSILVIEEIGKLSNIGLELVNFDESYKENLINKVDRSHRKKHFIGVMSGALINNRLDRILGKETIRRILHEAESDHFEKLRQSCLYIDHLNGTPVVPSKIIDEERAKTMVVLSGELIAEVLGFFPWEFERMIKNVEAFEIEIGILEEKGEI